jgi:two-component system, sensor histidine kinase and response regulator
VLLSQLASWGFHVDVTESGRAALELLRVGRTFDLIVTDMMMPEIDGSETLLRIQKLLGSETPPAILLTSMGSLTEEYWKSHGFAAGLCKPVRQSQLYDAIGTALDQVPATVVNEPVAALGSEPLRLKILLVEDNPINALVATRFLKTWDCAVTHAENGKLGAEQWRNGDFDLILMDVYMPVMDGFEATGALRQNPGPRQPWIIAMTANAMEGDREKCLAAGMNDYVQKPVRSADLLAALKRSPRFETVVAVSSSPVNPIHVWNTEILSEVPGTTDAELRMFLEAFLSQADSLLVGIHAAESPEARKIAAHTMKGAAASIGAERLAAACHELELHPDRLTLVPSIEFELRELIDLRDRPSAAA